MQNVIELHKEDLTKGHKALAEAIKKFGQGSAEMWDIKNRISKYEISFGQAANLAVQEMCSGISAGVNMKDFEEIHLYYYQHLTKPYRPEKKLKEGMVNIDDEIEIPKN